MTNSTQGRQFYLFDALGSVADLMTPGGGIQARYQYDAWGNDRGHTGTSANIFGFTGHELDAVTGLYYFKARFYDPETGLILTEDPESGEANNPPSLHRYLYAYANPTAYWDLDGRAGRMVSVPGDDGKDFVIYSEVIGVTADTKTGKETVEDQTGMDVQQALLKEWKDIRRASAQTVALGLGDDIGAGRIDSRYVAAMGETAVKIGMAYWASYGAALLAPMLLPEAPAWAMPFTRAGTGALSGLGAQGGSDLVDQKLSSSRAYFRSAVIGADIDMAGGLLFDFLGGVVTGYKGVAPPAIVIESPGGAGGKRSGMDMFKELRPEGQAGDSIGVRLRAPVADGPSEAVEGSVGKVTYFHQLKASKTTNLVVELQEQVDAQVAAMNSIVEREGIVGLQERIRLYRADSSIEQAGRTYVKTLGPAGCTKCGDPLAWLHGPDMATGGGPTDIIGKGLSRNNSILGGQANRIADEILAMPSTTTRIEGILTVKPAKVKTP